jgi:ABC-2 type transport system permease protein
MRRPAAGDHPDPGVTERSSGLLDKARACFRRDLVIDLSSRWSLLFQALHLTLAVLSYYFLATQFAPEGAARRYPAFPFLLVGIAVQGYMTTILVTFAEVIRVHQQEGTLKAVLVSPTSPHLFLLLSALYPMCRTTIDAAMYVIAGWLMGFDIAVGNPAGAFCVFIASLAAFCGIGIALATLSLISPRAATGVVVVVSASWLLSGGLYPTAVLPPVLQAVGAWLPATHAISGIRATLIDAEPTAAVLPQIGVLALFAAIMFPAGLAAFSMGIRRARIAGTLGHV